MVKFVDYLYLAKRDIFGFKLRSFLIILCITIGIFASTLNLYHTELRSDKLISQFQNMGTNLVSIWIQDENIDPSFLSLYFPIISYRVSSYNEVRYIKRKSKVSIIGTDSLYKTTDASWVEKGRFLTKEDIKRRMNVCVISSALAKELKADIGGKIRISDKDLRIIGVFKSPVLSHGEMCLLIPISIFKETIGRRENLEVVISSNNPNKTKEFVENAFKKRFPSKSKKGFDERFFISRLEGLDDIIKKQRFIGKMVVLGIGFITFLLAGGGIINLIMLSIRQRYKEIGIMRALGAKREEIFHLFLIEGFLFSLYGLLLGGMVSFFLTGLSPYFRLDIFLSSLFYSSLICIPLSICGYYPAELASKISPCEAIRVQ